MVSAQIIPYLFPSDGFEEYNNYINEISLERLNDDDFRESYSLGRSEISLLRKVEELDEEDLSSLVISDDKFPRNAFSQETNVISSIGLIILLAKYNYITKELAKEIVEVVTQIGLIFNENILNKTLTKLQDNI